MRQDMPHSFSEPVQASFRERLLCSLLTGVRTILVRLEGNFIADLVGLGGHTCRFGQPVPCAPMDGWEASFSLPANGSKP